MGGNSSHLEEEEDESSRIISFHSNAQWNAHFNDPKQTNKLMVIDFTATWCGPCRSMEPTLRQYADTYTDVNFVKLDVDELPDVAGEFGVQAMPSFILVQKGEVADRIVGARKEELKNKIEKHRRSLLAN